MKTIYNEADILSLHIPLNTENTYLINTKYLNNFKKNIYLINTSRGRCVNTKDLVNALKKKTIKGVCLDVFEYESNSFENLFRKGFTSEIDYLTHANNTILSPHIAGWTYESNIKIAEVLLKKIQVFNT